MALARRQPPARRRRGAGGRRRVPCAGELRHGVQRFAGALGQLGGGRITPEDRRSTLSPCTRGTLVRTDGRCAGGRSRDGVDRVEQRSPSVILSRVFARTSGKDQLRRRTVVPLYRRVPEGRSCEVQRVGFSAMSITGGTFTLTQVRQTTSNLARNASAADAMRRDKRNWGVV